MSVIVNLNTRQTPMATVGNTGAQVIKFIDAPRVYIKTSDVTPTPVAAKSNGSLPSGWTDLGIVDGKLKISYKKTEVEVRTGIDEVLRAKYVTKKTAQFEANLQQFDDVVMSQFGLTSSVLTAGSIMAFHVGAEDVIQKALLLVAQNKLDGKEIQFYSPNAYISFEIDSSNDYTFVKLMGDLPLFTDGSSESLFIQTHFA